MYFFENTVGYNTQHFLNYFKKYLAIVLEAFGHLV